MWIAFIIIWIIILIAIAVGYKIHTQIQQQKVIGSVNKDQPPRPVVIPGGDQRTQDNSSVPEDGQEGWYTFNGILIKGMPETDIWGDVDPRNVEVIQNKQITTEECQDKCSSRTDCTDYFYRVTIPTKYAICQLKNRLPEDIPKTNFKSLKDMGVDNLIESQYGYWSDRDLFAS